MAKREQIFRLMHIADFLKRKPKGITFEEISNFLEIKFQERGFELKFSEKTFKRDRELLLEILGIETHFKRSSKTYKIINEDLQGDSENILDNILLIDAYRQSKEHSDILIFEKRKSRGLHHLQTLIEAIKQNKIVSFQYHKFYEDQPENRTLIPMVLKEFKYRWYLLGFDFKSENEKIKIFGLDRISNLETKNTTAKKINFNLDEIFKNSFGIISTFQEVPQEIILSFEPFQGKYIKSLPIHSSQEILIDNKDEFRIKLNLVPTFDFIQEIFSHGRYVKIVAPESLKIKFKEQLAFMQKSYQ